MIKNYSDHTIIIQIKNVLYLELPSGWSDSRFEDEPDFEEFLRKKYPELNPNYADTITQTIKEEVATTQEETRKRKKRVAKK